MGITEDIKEKGREACVREVDFSMEIKLDFDHGGVKTDQASFNVNSFLVCAKIPFCCPNYLTFSILYGLDYLASQDS